MAESIGSVSIDVVPSAKSQQTFIEKLRAGIVPGAAKIGEDAGDAFVKAFQAKVAAGIADVFPKSDPATANRAKRSGSIAGDAFGSALDQRVGAAIKALPDIEIDANTDEAQAKLAGIRTQLDQIAHKNDLGIDLTDEEALAKIDVLKVELEELTGPEHDVRVRFDSAAAVAQIVALKTAIADLDKEADESSILGGGGSSNSTNGFGFFHNLVAVVKTIGPALVPAIGGLAALGSGAVAAGLSAELAIKGINAEIKAGTPQGLQYAGMVSTLKTDLVGLEKTAASGVFSGAQSGFGKLISDAPQLNVTLGQTSSIAGDIASHLAGAAAGGLKTFAPLLIQAEGEVDKLAARFEAWANGPGGAKFMQTLGTDLDEAIPALGSVATSVEHVVSAFGPAGGALIQDIGALADGLNAIPIQPLELLAAGYASVKAAQLAMTISSKLAGTALAGLTEEEIAAGEASTGFRGALSSGIGIAGKVAAAYVATAVATGAAAHATSSWELSTNGAARSVSSSLDGVSKLLTGHWQAAYSTVFGAGADQREADVAQYKNDVNEISVANKTLALQSQGFNLVGASGQAENAKGLFDASKLQAYSQAMTTVNAEQKAFAKTLSSTSVSNAASAYSDFSNELQKTVDQETASIGAGAKTAETIDGIKIGTAAYTAELNKQIAVYGDNAEAALHTQGAITGTAQAIKQQQDAVNRAVNAQVILGNFTTAAGAKYGLTADQVDTYTKALGVNLSLVAQGGQAYNSALTELGAFTTDLNTASGATEDMLNAFVQFSGAADTAASRAQLIGSILKDAQGDNLSYAQSMVTAATANQQLVTDMDAQTRATINLKAGTIDYRNAAAAPLINDLQSLQTASMNAAAATYQHETALGKASAATDAFNVFSNDTKGALVAEHTQLGLTTTQASALATTYYNLKDVGDIKNAIALVGSDKATQALDGILKDLDLLAKANPTVQVNLSIAAAEANLRTLQAEINATTGTAANGKKYAYVPGEGYIQISAASGGEIHGPGTSTSDSIHARLSDGEFVMKASAVKAIGVDNLNAMNNAPGFESGGFVNVIKNPNYNTAGSSAAKKAAAPAKAKAVKPLLTATSTVSLTTDITKFLQAISGTTAQIQSAEETLARAIAKPAGLGFVAAINAENNVLLKASNQRTSIANKLKTANTALAAAEKNLSDEYTTVSQAASSFFDIGSVAASSTTNSSAIAGITGASVSTTGSSAVTAASIVASAAAAYKTAALVRSQLAKLHSEGLNATTFKTLAENPVQDAGQISALANGTKAQITALNAYTSGLSGEARALGTNVATDLYGAGVNAAKGLVAGLASQEKTITAEMTKIADAMANQIEVRLGIHSPSTVMHEIGLNVGQGLINGILASHPGVATAATGMASRAVPQAVGAGVGGAGMPGIVQHITQQPNESSAELADKVIGRAMFQLRSR